MSDTLTVHRKVGIWNITADMSAQDVEKLQSTLDKVCAQNQELLEALEAIFENCTMIHNHWGDGNNTKQADEAIKAARAAMAKTRGEA